MAETENRETAESNQGRTKLIAPTMVLRTEFMEMVNEYIAAGDQEDDWRFEEALDDFEGYVNKFLDYAEGKNLPKGWVADSTFWLVEDGAVVLGRTSIRHSLTPALERKGGHIGYYIRPSQRGKGYGNLILRLSLEKAREIGLKKVLVTCDDDNIASLRTIVRYGGTLADKLKTGDSEVLTRRYWIDLSQADMNNK